MPAIKSCLWFHDAAEDAANFYVSIFPNSTVGHVMRAGSAVIGVEFALDGQPVMALNGRREAGFTDAHSLFVPCESQAEVDRFWEALSDGGREGNCGWLTDRFGVSWQVVPNELGALLGDPDRVKGNRVLQAMLGMKKLDVAALRRARDGEAEP